MEDQDRETRIDEDVEAHSHKGQHKGRAKAARTRATTSRAICTRTLRTGLAQAGQRRGRRCRGPHAQERPAQGHAQGLRPRASSSAQANEGADRLPLSVPGEVFPARRAAVAPLRACPARLRRAVRRSGRAPRPRRLRSSSTVRAARAFCSRSSAIAASFANRPSSSISASENAACCGRSSTSSTPSVRSSCSSGTAIRPFGTKPVDSAASRAKRGSLSSSSTTSGWRVTSTQPAMPVLEGKRWPTSSLGALAGDGLEHQLVGLLVEQEHRRGAGAEDRARHLHDRLQQLPVALLGAEGACRDCGAQVAHLPPPTLLAVR